MVRRRLYEALRGTQKAIPDRQSNVRRREQMHRWVILLWNFPLWKSEFVVSCGGREMRRSGLRGAAAGERSRKRIFRLGSQRNPLIRLDSDKRIQGIPSLFSLISFARLGWTLPDLVKFGI
jgi:hypothetical protein